MIKIVNGNILNAAEDIICHQVNCQGVMGGGLAKQIRDKYPSVYAEYKEHCIEYKREDLLGTTLIVQIFDYDIKYFKIIANLFGQNKYGRDKQYTDYNALKSSFLQLKEYADHYGYSIAIPYQIGCGLAGGDWNIVHKIIEEIFNDYDVTIYKL